MTRRERNEVWVTRVIRLPQDVTWDLFNHPYRHAYSFLHKTGEYLRVGSTNKDAAPITVGSWPEALLHAQRQEAEFIVSFKEKRVFFRVVTQTGAFTWMPATPIPHDSIEVLNNAETAPYEPLADGTQPKRKQPSGAQKRKRYGG